MMRRMLLAAYVLLLCGCAVAPKDAPEYSELTYGGALPGMAQVFISRQNTPPSAFEQEVYVNDIMIASLPLISFTSFYVPSGTVRIKLDWPSGYLHLFKSEYEEFVVEEGETYLFQAKSNKAVLKPLDQRPRYLKDYYWYIPPQGVETNVTGSEASEAQ